MSIQDYSTQNGQQDDTVAASVVEISQHGMDRKAASKLLKISIRTLDRYIKQKKLSSRVIDGRVWLNNKEVRGYLDRQRGKIMIEDVDMSTSEMTIDNIVDPVDKRETRRRQLDPEERVYKELYTSLKEEVSEKQERLEIANYRVGQLEAQIKNSIPMLTYHKENYEKRQEEEKLKNTLSEQKGLISRLSQRVRQETLSKRIILGMLLVFLALQPLWLLIIFK